MERSEALLVDALRCAIRGESVSWPEPPDGAELRQLIRLSREQNVLPLVMEAIAPLPGVSAQPVFAPSQRLARTLTLRQAARTADFLLVLEHLEKQGLRPAVLKGPVCRALYPEPEQRASSDEDLLIAQEEFPRYQEALLSCGLKLREKDIPPEGRDEVAFLDPERELYLEVHMKPFAEIAACADCGAYFEGALSRLSMAEIYGREILTLEPTDHLLYLLCHAYKHILYGGAGLRMLCDICLFARELSDRINWERVRRSCEQMGILKLTAAVFRVGERHLELPVPEVFSDLSPDELPLLRDCLSGGIYGAEDPDRLHSNAFTLDAAIAQKQGRARRGLLRALFPPVSAISGRFPYLRSRPWLLPAAWAERAWIYAFEKGTRPSQTLRIGQERIELLKQYDLLS